MTEDNPVWKDIFYGSIKVQGSESDWGLIREKKWNLGLDAEIESMGGFKQLVTARYKLRKSATAITSSTACAKQNLPNETCMGQEDRRCLGISTDALETSFRSKHQSLKRSIKVLFLVRLQGSLVLWGLDTSAKDTMSDVKADVNLGLLPARISEALGIETRLQPVVTTNHFLEIMEKDAGVVAGHVAVA